ncbi:hypothetical protein HanXRQr2_Chr07g0286841 [Helianthus annuus]|uniref:Uncharacterized protein n=1 Tax=Helianthus annuus TaxID=4232 RepID=A0A9K3NFK3_HELAN|nr:hypothetical protein HanXRQr2_Chr07g0286841 [Helianthus annuus]KAJ0904082.1 hypothetical protein HanPSC8_Chr07g0277731 [Helianthus annuus]
MEWEAILVLPLGITKLRVITRAWSFSDLQTHGIKNWWVGYLIEAKTCNFLLWDVTD